MSRTHDTIALPTGVTLDYVAQGDPDGVPLVLLHGYSDSSLSFELLLDELPSSLRAFALTQRGHGDAPDRPLTGYRPEDHAADVLAFLDAQGIGAAVIAGHSGGSYTTQRFAIDHPQRTLGAVLIGAFHDLLGNPDVAELVEVIEQLSDPVDPEFVRGFQESTVSRPVPDGWIDRVVAESRKLPARVWQAYLREMSSAPAPARTGTIDVPVLLLWGDRDAYCRRADQEAVLAVAPRGRLSTYAGTGHCPHWEQPVRAAAEVHAFAVEVASVAV